jgi:hypothetical protein
MILAIEGSTHNQEWFGQPFEWTRFYDNIDLLLDETQ